MILRSIGSRTKTLTDYFAMEPSACKCPVALHRAIRNIQTLSDLGYRQTSDVPKPRDGCGTEWSMKIDPSLGLSLLGGIRWQFQSQVPAGENPDDTRVYAGLKLDF